MRDTSAFILWENDVYDIDWVSGFLCIGLAEYDNSLRDNQTIARLFAAYDIDWCLFFLYRLSGEW